MSIIMLMEWETVTPAQYEEARRRVNWEGDVPAGAISHVAAFSESGLRVVDVWESADEMQAFFDQRLMPVTSQLGIETEPRVEVYPVHALFTPAFGPARKPAIV